MPLIAKIEKPQAAANAEEIIEAADGIMVARGDLGIELPIEEVPLVQKRLLALAGRRAKPTITATQMLESMVHSTRPTRAEVADVANAIFDGTDAVMLSQETAVGQHPVLAVQMMASIAETTERELPYGRWLAERGPQANNQYHAIAFGAVGARLPARAQVHRVADQHRHAPRALISAYRPQAPVLALSPRTDVVRRCQLLWGVHPRLNEEPMDTLELLEACAEAAERERLRAAGRQDRDHRRAAGAAAPAARTCSRCTRSSRASVWGPPGAACARGTPAPSRCCRRIPSSTSGLSGSSTCRRTPTRTPRAGRP